MTCAAPADEDLGAVPVLLLIRDGRLRSLAEIDTDTIRFALVHHRGNVSEVARALGLGRSTLYRRLHALGLQEAAHG